MKRFRSVREQRPKSRQAMTLAVLLNLPAIIYAQDSVRQGVQRDLNGLSPTIFDLILLLGLFSLVGVVVSFRFYALRRESRRAERTATERMRETDDVTDELLQGVQGLLLTFHVAAQNISEDHAAKKLMNHALCEADALVSTGRKRFERAAFQAASEDHLVAEGCERDAILDAVRISYLAPCRHERNDQE
jgi:hypothetical protein